MLSDLPVLAADDIGTIDARCGLGESPSWLPGEPGTLLWVDCDRAALHWRRGAARSQATLDVEPPLVAVTGRSDGGLVVLAGRTVHALDHPRAAPRPLVELPDEPAGVRFNDAKPGPAGRLWAGTVVRGARGAGALWSYRADEGLVRHWGDVTHGNGIGWDVTGTRMYVVDSGEGTLSRSDVDPATGLPGLPTVLLTVPRADGLPDGLAVDEDGCVWLAVWGAGCVVRVTPEGRPLGRLDLPARNPTSCAFIGPDLAVLAVTSAADETDPAAPGGDVYLRRVGAVGVPVGSVIAPTSQSHSGRPKGAHA